MSEINYSKYRWYILIAMCVATIIQGVILISPAPLVQDISISLNTDLGSTTAAAVFSFTAAVAIGGLLGGFIIDKIGLIKTFIITAIIIIVSTALMPIVGTSVTGFAVLRAIQGFACAPVTISGPRVAAEWFPPHQRAMYQGFTSAALNIGITVGLFASPAITSVLNWNMALLIIGLVYSIALILFIIMAFGPKPPVIVQKQEVLENTSLSFATIFKMPTFWFTLVAFFFLTWVSQGFNGIAPGYLAVPAPVGLGLGAQQAGMFVSILTLSFVLGSLSCSFFLNKIFRSNTRLGIVITYIITGLFCSSIMLPFVQDNTIFLAIFLFIAGFFMGMPGPFALGFVATKYPAHITGRIGGILTGLGIFGGAFSTALCSLLLSETGAYTIPIILLSGACIIGALAGLGVKAPNFKSVQE